MNVMRGVLSRKQELVVIIKPLAKQAQHLTELASLIKQKGLVPYYRRGILTGIKDINNKKYRLKRLGITIERVNELTQEELRLRELQSLQNQKNKNRML